MRVFAYIKRMLVPQRCMGCGEILAPEQIDKPLCNKCRIAWNKALINECSECHMPAFRCTCMPKLISKAGALCCRRLMFYSSDNSYSPELSVVYYNKRIRVRRLTDFLSEQIVMQIRPQLWELEAEENVIVSFVPRSRGAYLKYGFDQSEALAEAVAGRLGIECVRIFGTHRSSKPQKELSAEERLKNSKKSIYVADNVSVKDKYVVLVDDIITTGAGMSVCIRHLRDMGCRGVLCFCLASKNKM